MRWQGKVENARSQDGESWQVEKSVVSAKELEFLCPVSPSKIIGVGKNFPDPEHPVTPQAPELFLMPPSALIGTNQEIRLPKYFDSALAEGEVGVVIKDRIKSVSPKEALQHILGYTIVNDLSGRDSSLDFVSSLLKKGCDGFLPVGPWIVQGVDPSEMEIQTFVNDECLQKGSLREMKFSIGEIISFISQAVTLEAGDLISMGAPAPKPKLLPGCEVEVRVSGIGSLRNRIL